MRPIRLKSTRYDLTHLLAFCGCKTGAEIGVEHGYFSHYLLRHSALELLWSVDSFMERKHGPVAQDAEAMLRQFGKRSRMIYESSEAAAARAFAENQRFDFCYIDANHRREYVSQDLSLWLPLVNSGGFISGHDYIAARGHGVIEAVDEFAHANDLQLVLTSEPWSTFIMFL